MISLNELQKAPGLPDIRNPLAEKDFTRTIYKLAAAMLCATLIKTFCSSMILSVALSIVNAFDVGADGRYLAFWVLNDIVCYGIPILALWIPFSKELKQPYRCERYNFSYIEIFLLYLVIVLAGNINELFVYFMNSCYGATQIADPFSSVLPQNDFQITVMLVAVCVTGPIFEEFIYRYLMLKPLRKLGDGMAVLITALIFGLAHGNLAQFLNAFLCGLVIGFIAVRSNSIIPPLILHIMNNVANSLPSFLRSYSWSGSQVDYICYFIGFLQTSLPILAVLTAFYYLRKHELKPDNAMDNVSTTRKLLLFVRNPVAIIMLAVLVYGLVD